MLAVVAEMSQHILAKSAVPSGWLTAYVKDPTDPQWQDTPEYKDWLAWMKKYNTSGNVSDIFTVWGYSAAQTMVAVLKQCGDDLTRENVMKQAANIHDLKLSMLLPGNQRP
jgi:branched-chain amino acid transport system substrate-binding protein